MSAAPETKYTDRDVRESPDLTDRAIHWVENYTGEFEYLIDMKMRVASGYPLTTPMIRGILNCMRHDPRITDLPAPLAPDRFADGSEERVVVPMTRNRPRRKRELDRDCEELKPHYAHWWTDQDAPHARNWCEGVEWPINRLPGHWYRAKVKVAFVAARTGSLIHRVQEGGDHSFRWKGNTHEWGFYGDPDLHVKLVCRFPSIIKNPLLLRDEDVAALRAVGLDFCQHCDFTSETGLA